VRAAAAAAALLCLRLINAEHRTLYITSYTSLTVHHLLCITYGMRTLPQVAVHCMTNRLWYSQNHDTIIGVHNFAVGL